jgi:putative ubiquitin-RnfH superfamily antitoxin RatB of RatAB toxin-antitoxin module
MTGRIAVCVAYAAPGIEALVDLVLPPGADVGQAVAASGITARLGLAAETLVYAIHGQRVPLHTPLADGDRVELTRPLVAEPQQARRTRATVRPLAKPPPRPKARGG